MFSAVLFDLDETLIADEPVSKEAFFTTALEVTRDEPRAHRLAEEAERVARLMGHELPAPAVQYCLRIGHSPLEALWARYDRSIAEEAVLDDAVRVLRPEVWRRALKTCDEHGTPEAMAARWQHVRAQYPLFPDTNLVLSRLRGVTKLGIVTNGVRGLQRQKLEGSGLLHWFDAVAVSGEVRIGKPERGIFDWVAGQLGVDVTDCLMVGDNADRDVLGGTNAGMKTVWVDRGLKPCTQPATWVTRSLRDVLPLVLG